MSDASTIKIAANQHPILDLLRKRWSARALDAREVPRATVASLLEAARWAPSAGNSQPWRYLVFDGSDAAARADAEACLEPGNAWAKRAPVLLMGVTKETNHKGAPNGWGRHDLGLATENLLLQASALGLVGHPMAGFDQAEAKKRFTIPDDFAPLTMIAIGYPGGLSTLDEKLRAREVEARTRKPMAEIAFAGRWEKPFVP